MLGNVQKVQVVAKAVEMWWIENIWPTPSIWHKTERLTPKWRLKITRATPYKTKNFWLHTVQQNHILCMKLWYYFKIILSTVVSPGSHNSQEITLRNLLNMCTVHSTLGFLAQTVVPFRTVFTLHDWLSLISILHQPSVLFQPRLETFSSFGTGGSYLFCGLGQMCATSCFNPPHG